MKIYFPILVIIIAGCSATTTTSESDKLIYKTIIEKHIVYRHEKAISDKVKRECNIGTPLSESVQKNAKDYNILIERVDNINNDSLDNYIKMDILSAVSGNFGGAPGLRHTKMVSIEATMYENGKAVHRINRTRNSKGGVLGGLMTSCDVLEIAVKKLGSDVAERMNIFLKKRASASAKQ